MNRATPIHPAALAAATAALQPYYPELSPASLVAALKNHKAESTSEKTDIKPMTKKEAADFLKVTTNTIHRYIALGRLQAHKVGPRMVRIDPRSIEALAHGREMGA